MPLLSLLMIFKSHHLLKKWTFLNVASAALTFTDRNETSCVHGFHLNLIPQPNPNERGRRTIETAVETFGWFLDLHFVKYLWSSITSSNVSGIIEPSPCFWIECFLLTRVLILCHCGRITIIDYFFPSSKNAGVNGNLAFNILLMYINVLFSGDISVCGSVCV